MAINKKNIEQMISKILEEEINAKSNRILKEMQEGGEWTEIEVDEELSGGQEKLDVAEPKGKLTADDFKLLRKKGAKKEMDEFFFRDDEDDESEEEAEELSQNEPTYVGKGLEDNKIKANLKNKIFGSFSDDLGWFDEKDYEHKGGFDFDYDEEEFDEFEPMFNKYGKDTLWFAPGDEGKKFFNMYKEKYGPMKIRVMKGLEEETETDEGNAFSGALANAKKEHKKTFKVDGETYPVKESKAKKCPKCGMENCKCKHKKETNEKWDGEVKVKKTGQYSDMSISDINSEIKKLKTKNDKTKNAGKKVSDADRTKMSQLYFAKRAKKDWPGKGKAAVKENKLSLSLNEEELIDLIEKIVLEEQKKTKNNITEKQPEGLKKTEKVLKAGKKENDDYAKQVVEKMKDYLKDSTKGNFEMNPKAFPLGNGQIDKKAKSMKYNPSQAVEEYIEAFAYPGQTNLVFDEIKPDDEKIEMYLKGNRKTGNAELGEDGKPLGNVVPSKVGERFKKNYDENLYGAEQMEVSYKRQPQPVDTAGEAKESGSLKSIRKGSNQKAQKIMSQLESLEKNEKKPINEEVSKMKELISYNRKTQ